MNYTEIAALTELSLDPPKEPPKTHAESIYFAVAAIVSLSIWATRAFITSKIKIAEADYAERLKGEKQEREQEKLLIKNLIYQNQVLLSKYNNCKNLLEPENQQ